MTRGYWKQFLNAGLLAVSLGVMAETGFAAESAAVSSAVPGLEERAGAVTMKGNPVTLIGPEIRVGDKAPDFTVQAAGMQDARLSDFQGRIKLIASVPSLDTPVCDLEIRRFNQEAAKIAGDAAILFISMDLPFAQKRFCAAAGIQNVQALSDHRTAEFGAKYGVLIKDLRLLTRAVFILDRDNTVRYVEYVKENASEPDYAAALEALKKLLI